MKCELLAPCGSLESLYAAISNGATSVYFGGSAFNARMYANNFNDDEIKEAIEYAHKRNVRVFITLNILIKDSELEEVKKYINKLYLLNIDGIIVQDYGLINYIKENYNDLFLNCSTQTTIDDLESVKYFENLNVNRVVLARECSLDTIKKIKENTNVEIEVFAHGALCVSYSGQCLLSSYIGDRSGNRGKCAQPCRKKYMIIDLTSNTPLSKEKEYSLSLKDLKTIDNLDDILDLNIDSLKLEGRMKNPEYVANIVKYYRNKLDSYYSNSDFNLNEANTNLQKTFHRNFTNGYIFNANTKTMNANKNNVGLLIGKVTNPNYKGYIEITLNDTLNQNDIIRFNNKEETTSKLVKLFDSKLKLINSSSNIAYINIKEKIPNNTLVYKTFDYKYDLELKHSFPIDKYKHPINVTINAYINKNLEITIEYFNKKINYSLDYIIEKANSSVAKDEQIINQISKLNDTPFYLNNITINKDKDIFISIKALNELRRNAINKLIDLLLINNRKEKEIKTPPSLNIYKEDLTLTFKTHTLEQYEYLKSLGYKYVYFDNNSTLKVNNKYDLDSQFVLARNYGSLYKYNDKEIIIDYSLNVFNHLSSYYFFKHGAKRITPSIELSTNEYIELYNNFITNYNIEPNFEFVIYSNVELMISKYCPLKLYNQCGKCQTKKYVIEDDYEKFNLYTDKNCHMHLLTYKKLNKIKEISKIKNYTSALRLEFFDETKEEIKKIIDEVNHQLSI